MEKKNINTENEKTISANHILEVVLETQKQMHTTQTHLATTNENIKLLSDAVVNLNSVVSGMMGKINELGNVVDVYKRRDLEQTARIRSLENDEKFDYVKDIVSEIIRVRDIAFRKYHASTNEEVKESYALMVKHLDVSLSRCNVYPYQSKMGDVFDPRIHLANAVEITRDKKLVDLIYKSTSCGYFLTYTVDGTEKKKILVYEKVCVYELKK